MSAARTLAARDVRVISVGVGRSAYAPVLRAVADAGGGTYLRANGTSRLRILFGDDERRYRGRSLTVVDGSHFVTAGVRLTARLPFTNDVAVKRGASFLAATGAGDPAVAAWRYATGRVVAVTAHGNRGGLDGLLSRPDSLLVSKSVNWAIGDPRRKARRRATVPDTRVGRPTTVVYRGDERPEPGNRSLSFSRAGSGRYEATLRPARRGYRTLLGTEYAVDYREEYAGFGPSPALSTLVTATGGRTFEPDAAAAVARAVARQSRHVREVRTDWAPAAVLAALVAFVVEVAARRLAGYRTEGIP